MRFDFLLFFAIYYYVMLNDDKLWQAQKGVRTIRTVQKIFQNACKKAGIKKNISVHAGRVNMSKNKNSHPEGCIYEQFAYRSHLVVYPNSSDMNKLSAIVGKKGGTK